MPTAEISFLVRGPDGRCVTVQARTTRGALRRFLLKHSASLQTGDYVAVKPRGEGDWVDYRIAR